MNAQHIKPLILTVDAVVCPHALANLIGLIEFDFGNQVRIGNVRAGHADKVYIAPFQNALSLIGILNILRVHHRYANHFFNACR